MSSRLDLWVEVKSFYDGRNVSVPTTDRIIRPSFLYSQRRHSLTSCHQSLAVQAQLIFKICTPQHIPLMYRRSTPNHDLRLP